MVTIPDDGLARYPGWQVSTKLRRVDDDRAVSALVTVTAKPGMEKTLEEVLRTLTTHARENKGWMNYEVQRDVHNHRTSVISEMWSNRDTFEAHGVAPYMDVYKRSVGPFRLVRLSSNIGCY